MDSRGLPYSFYARSARTVARNLLGQILVHEVDGGRISGRIVETEAYCHGLEPDLACHGMRNNRQPTERTAVMFGPAGHAYVYLSYGIHWLFNVVSGRERDPSAVLIRALEPLDGEAEMATRRSGRPRSEWTNGPGKLTKALGIDQSHNKSNLCAPDGVVWIEAGESLSAMEIGVGPRVGLGKTPEPWFSVPWRYWILNNSFVSAYR